MTLESLEFLYDKFLAMNGCDANAIICDKCDIGNPHIKQFCWDHDLSIFECISSYQNFPVKAGEPKFILI